MDIIVSDFDSTLFKRNYGLIRPAIEFLEEKRLPIYIVTYRAEDQKQFILDTLAETNLDIIGIGFAASRKKEPVKKIEIILHLAAKHNVTLVLDDDEQVVLRLRQQGIMARRA